MRLKPKIISLAVIFALSTNFSVSALTINTVNDYNTNIESSVVNKENLDVIYSESELKDYLINKFLAREENIECVAYNINTTFDIKLLENTIRNINKENKLIESMIKTTYFQSTEYLNKTEYVLNVVYQSSKEEYAELDKHLDEVLMQIITEDMLDYEKVTAVHDYIAKTYEYDTDYQNYSAYKMYADGKGVCQAYTLMMYYMLDKLDIPVDIVDGYVNNDETARHTWNQVNLGGYWFHIDTTWDDPIPDVKDHAYHNYFCLTDEEIEKDHTILGKEYINLAYKNYQEYISQLLASKDSLIRERTTDYINVKIHDSYIDFASIETGTDREAVLPLVENSRTLVPIRSIADALAYEVSWNQEEATAYLVKDEIIIKIKPDDKNMIINDKIYELDVPARVINNRILIPIRAISEAMGYIVYWQQDTKDILIY